MCWKLEINKRLLKSETFKISETGKLELDQQFHTNKKNKWNHLSIKTDETRSCLQCVWLFADKLKNGLAECDGNSREYLGISCRGLNKNKQ